MVNARIYQFNYPNKKIIKFLNVITYTPIIKGVIFLIIVFLIIIIIYTTLNSIFIYSLALVSPFITVALIQIIDGYKAFKYEITLKSALINEIIYNLESIKANENVLHFELTTLKENRISTDPLVTMIWDIWDIIKLHYAYEKPNFDLDTVYNYIRGLYVLNEAINERRMYTMIDFSAREEFNKIIYKTGSMTVNDIKNSLEQLNVKIFIFNDNFNSDTIASTLNQEKIPAPLDIIPLLEKKLDELIIIVNQN